jgi:hypothetical protein
VLWLWVSAESLCVGLQVQDAARHEAAVQQAALLKAGPLHAE